MAQMNKRPEGFEGSGKRKELEAELIADIAEQASDTGIGRDMVKDDPYSRSQARSHRQFTIQQGKRRRHPKRVLAQFAQIVKETSNAESAWEKALMHEQKRVEVPEEYKIADGEMVANQTGLVTTALDNYKKSKMKFVRESLVGI